jgi:hypothetical protein
VNPVTFEKERRERSMRLSDAVATIIVAEDGDPIRTAIDGRSLRAKTLFSTCKGVAFTVESNAERALAFASEADPAIERMLGQPHRLEFTTRQGVRHIYIPDLRRDLRNGRTQIIECKADDGGFEHDPFYERKLELAGEVYALLGWTFEKRTLGMIVVEPRFTSLKRIARDGFLLLRPAERHAVFDALNARGPMPLGELADAIAPAPRGSSVIFHLMCLGLVTIDLRWRLGPGSIVSLFDPAAEPLT